MEFRKIQTEKAEFGNKHITVFGEKIKWILQGPKYVGGFWCEMTTGGGFFQKFSCFNLKVTFVKCFKILNIIKWWIWWWSEGKSILFY